ncbi:MAG: sulfatase-like hydrolase/transferase [Myxococcales bacterium]|nr:sulfatase-like hydrolase/transferase [Myxococcales bacterium]
MMSPSEKRAPSEGQGHSGVGSSDTGTAALIHRPRWRGATALLLGLWWAYRVAATVLLGSAWPEVASGAAIDAIVVAALVLAAHKPGVIALAGLAVLLRALDLVSCVVAHSHVSPVVWWHLDPQAWRVAVEAGAPVVLGMALGFAWLATRVLRRASRGLQGALTQLAHDGDSRAFLVATRGHWLSAIVAFSLLAQSAAAPRDALDGGAVPEVDVLRSWLTFSGLRTPPESTPPDDATKRRWMSYGWLPTVTIHVGDQPQGPGAAAGKQMDALTGVLKTALAKKEAGPPPRGAVIVLMESMNAGFSQLYHPDAPLKTPGLQAFADRGVVVQGVLTQSRPTHNGIMASLCGRLPGTWPLDSARGMTLPRLSGCLPHAIAKAGGRSVFMQGSRLGFSGLGRTLQAMGFDDTLGLEKLATAGASHGPWGLHDRHLYAAALKQLAKLRAQKGRFLLVISTVDGHLPGAPHPECKAAGQGAVRAQACADAELLSFAKQLSALGKLDETLLVVTADHAAPDQVRSLLPKGAGGTFAEIPLIITGPQRGVRKVSGGQLDLPATVAGRMALPGVAGVDLLRGLGRSRVRLSTQGRRRIGVATDTGRIEVPLAEVERYCRTGRALPLTDAPKGLACDVARYLHAIDRAWHAKN